MQHLAGRTNTSSLRYASAVDIFVVGFWQEVLNSKAHTLEEEDMESLYGMHVTNFVKYTYWDTMNIEVTWRLGPH